MMDVDCGNGRGDKWWLSFGMDSGDFGVHVFKAGGGGMVNLFFDSKDELLKVLEDLGNLGRSVE